MITAHKVTAIFRRSIYSLGLNFKKVIKIMPAYCIAVGCKNKRNSETKKKNITFHRYPRDLERRKQWNDAIQRPSKNGKEYHPNDYSFVCSEHFTDQDFNRFGNTIRLWESAVPSIFKVNRHCRLGRPRKEANSNEEDNPEKCYQNAEKISSISHENSNFNKQESMQSTYIEVNLDPDQLNEILEINSNTRLENSPSAVAQENNQNKQPKPPDRDMKRLPVISDNLAAVNEDHSYQLPEAQALRIRLDKVTKERDRLQKELHNIKDREQLARKNCEVLLHNLKMVNGYSNQNEIEIIEI